MDGADLEATALLDDRIGCRRGERSVEVRCVQDTCTVLPALFGFARSGGAEVLAEQSAYALKR